VFGEDFRDDPSGHALGVGQLGVGVASGNRERVLTAGRILRTGEWGLGRLVLAAHAGVSGSRHRRSAGPGMLREDLLDDTSSRRLGVDGVGHGRAFVGSVDVLAETRAQRTPTRARSGPRTQGYDPAPPPPSISRSSPILAEMCGRFVSLSDPDELAERFGVDEVRTDALPRRFNVAPSTDVYAILESEERRRLGTLRWGFVPHWATKLKGTRQPINARVETVATSKMFASAFERRRCLIPADGFYEWQARGEGRPKQPFHLADPARAPLAFAGIWTVWRDPQQPDAESLFSTAIITTAARGEMEHIHERMPVILPERLWSPWLTATPERAPHLRDAVAALGAPRLVATPIGTLVNSVRNDGPELLEPATLDESDPG
jgi:putative SOS response-associated peptidase YedK